MTSEPPSEAFVWIWLPRSSEPVVAGRLSAAGDSVDFNYGTSFLAREDAIALYLPDLPLRSGLIRPPDGMRIAGCVEDAAPDAWGLRVLMRRLAGAAGQVVDPAALTPLQYLLGSGSNRVGALDFQSSPTEYVERDEAATLDELVGAAQRIESGEPFTPELDLALLHGSSIGGARPKALLRDGDRQLIAKFASSSDVWPVVQGEYAAMEIARLAGLDVASVELVESLGKPVLLVDRFDRVAGTCQRRMIVSALTILELDAMMARYASYANLAHVIRQRFSAPAATLRELFSRITFNILVGNNDDHARNHVAFWDGAELSLAPAVDICPQVCAGGETAQLMAIGEDGFRMSQVAGCVERAGTYLLTDSEAREIIDAQIETIETHWPEVAERARLTASERDYFWRRQFLNPYALEGYPRAGS